MTGTRLTLAIGALVAAAALLVPLGSASATPATQQTAYEYLKDRPRQYSRYLALAERAGITPFLKAPRKRTWIIPTNAAVERVPAHRLRALRASGNRTRLRRELLTGVLSGARTPAQLRRGVGRNLRSILGSPIRISHQGGRLELNHGARISRKGTRVANGVVYVTDTALVKPDRTRAPGFADPSADGLAAPHTCTANTDVLVVECTFETASGDYVVSDLANLISSANTALGSSPDVTKDTMMWIVGVGGAGGVGSTFGGCCKGGAEGRGGAGALFTSVNSLVGAYGTSALYYYVGQRGSAGGNWGIAGGGGASTIVALEPPPDPVDWVAPSADEVLAVAAGGGGGGAASGNWDGGAGGAGAVAVSTDSASGQATGGNGQGGKKSVGGKGGGGGVGGAASYPACGSPNWCKGQNGIGGFGAPHTINGSASDGAGWLNEAFYSTQNIDNKSVNYRLTPGAGGIGQGQSRDCGNADKKDQQACGGAGGAGYGGGAAGQPQDTTFDAVGYELDKNGGGGGGGGSLAAAGTCTPPPTAASQPPVPMLSSGGDGSFTVVVMASVEQESITCK